VIVIAFVLVAAAGAIGRALIGHRLNRAFPVGTLVINASGAFALGLLHGATPSVVTVVGTGGLGAYTTFSSFARDAVALADQREWARAVGYVVATLVAGVAAAVAGLALSRGSW
jgi:fluoride exporter